MRDAIATSDLKATRSARGDETTPNELTFSLVIRPGQLATTPQRRCGFRGDQSRDDKDEGATRQFWLTDKRQCRPLRWYRAQLTARRSSLFHLPRSFFGLHTLRHVTESRDTNVLRTGPPHAVPFHSLDNYSYLHCFVVGYLCRFAICRMVFKIVR